MALSLRTSLPETIRVYGRAFRSRAITQRDLRGFRRRYGDVLGPTPAPTGGDRPDREPLLLDLPAEARGHVREGVPAPGPRAGRARPERLGRCRGATSRRSGSAASSRSTGTSRPSSSPRRSARRSELLARVNDAAGSEDAHLPRRRRRPRGAVDRLALPARRRRRPRRPTRAGAARASSCRRR